METTRPVHLEFFPSKIKNKNVKNTKGGHGKTKDEENLVGWLSVDEWV